MNKNSKSEGGRKNSLFTETPVFILTFIIIPTFLMALFWLIWYRVAGEVPVLRDVVISDKTTYILPYGISRWWDIAQGPLWSLMIISLYNRYKYYKKIQKEKNTNYITITSQNIPTVIIGGIITGLICSSCVIKINIISIMGGASLGLVINNIINNKNKSIIILVICVICGVFSLHFFLFNETEMRNSIFILFFSVILAVGLIFKNATIMSKFYMWEILLLSNIIIITICTGLFGGIFIGLLAGFLHAIGLITAIIIIKYTKKLHKFLIPS